MGMVGSISVIQNVDQDLASISNCGDFVAGPNSSWPHVLVATTVADGSASQGSQTYSMNITSLPADGANLRFIRQQLMVVISLVIQ